MKKFLFGAAALPTRAADAALLLFRLHVGLSIAIGAGWAKLVQLTSATEVSKLVSGAALGPPDWFVEQVAGLGFTFPSPYLWAGLAVWGEFIGGILIALGLCTRLGALQLVVQFFVIAFLWYETPEPILGMYYQQLLFWSFVLLTVVGGGRFSLDYWLSLPAQRRRVPWRPPATASLAAVALLLCGAPAQAQQLPPTVTMRELRPLAQQWSGTLTYVDYSSKRPVVLPTALRGRQSGPQQLILGFTYQEPSGQQVQGTDKVELSADGRTLTWDKTALQLTSKVWLPNQVLQLILQGRGEDDDKPCLVRKTILLGPVQVSVSKEVSFSAADGFITRNTYLFGK